MLSRQFAFATGNYLAVFPATIRYIVLLSHKSFGVALLGFGCFVTAVQADEVSPAAWLEKMSTAMQKLSYQGTFVYRSEESFSAMRVIHVVDESGSREILETLTGDARRETRRTPVEQLANKQEADAFGRLQHIENYYNLTLAGMDRTAGRLTRLLQVVPRDEYRYGYRLWLDDETGLLLKSDLLNEKGEVLEQVMFTSLELLSPGGIASVMPAPSVDEKIDTTEIHAHVPTTSAKPAWNISKLPSGFELMDMQPRRLKHSVDHMVYSDGLASVSVFVEESSPDKDALVGLSTRGAVNAYGLILDEYQVTVVGEVPAVTVKTISQAFARLSPEQ